MLSLMYTTDFVWLVGNDENRISDGRALRLTYLSRPGHEDSASKEDISLEPVKFLEVLIALSERVAFLTNQDARDWAWNLVELLKLDRFRDPLSANDVEKIKDILETVIWRAYGPDGSGGFFPLANPEKDQTKVEVWYQMTAYIKENRESFDL